MNQRSRSTVSALLAALFTLGLASACRQGPPDPLPEASASIDHSAKLGPQTSAVAADLSLGWCGGHGVPESVCTRCDASLISTFKEAGDWCDEHGLPESQCTVCHPEVAAAWAKLDPRGPAGQSPGEAVVAAPAGNWCHEHGVPESVCTRCDPSLIARFKETGDWCSGHGLPESQCSLCNPEVREKWASLRPQPEGGGQTRTSTDVEVERVPRLLSGTNDPLCQVDALRVRFLDRSIVGKAGIEVEPVRRRRMSAAIEVPAGVEFDATRVTRVTSRLAGIVRQAPVQVGDQVEAGALLATIDSPVLGEAKSGYIQRQQDLRLAEADSQRVRTIHQGVAQMLQVCTPEADAEAVRQALANVPVGDAKAKLLRAHASLQLARAEAVRESQLLEKKVTSERSRQSALSALDVAEASFAAIREEIAFDSERDRLVADRALRVAQSALDAAERRLHILGLSDEQVAVIGQESDELLSRYELRSPAGGRIVQREVAAGESVDEAAVLFVVADISMMWLVADVYERDLLRLRTGLPVIFTIDGLDGVSFQAALNWISSQVNDRTRTVRVRADLSNQDRLLRAGMFGRAKIVLHDNGDVISVPVRAVQTDGCCQLVFVQESDTVYQPRKVLLGAGANGFVEVLKGLDEGDVVATTGSFLMKTEILKSNIGAGCCEVDPGR